MKPIDRQPRTRALGPLNDRDCRFVQESVPIDRIQVAIVREAVEVDVLQAYPARSIQRHDDVAGRRYWFLDPKPHSDALRHHRLARAELALQRNDIARLSQMANDCTELARGVWPFRSDVRDCGLRWTQRGDFDKHAP